MSVWCLWCRVAETGTEGSLWHCGHYSIYRILCTVVGKSKWYYQVFQDSFHLKRLAVQLNPTWVDLAFSCTKGYPGQVKRHSLPFQVEAVLNTWWYRLLLPTTVPTYSAYIRRGATVRTVCTATSGTELGI